VSELDRRIASITASNRGLITLHDLRGVGAGSPQVSRRLATDRLHRVERGVYAVDGLPPDPDRDLLATTLATRGLVAVSHLAAARRFDIPGYSRAPLEISVQRGVRLRRGHLRVHESTDLDRCRIVEVDGIPVTDPARTLLDLARYVGPQRLARNMEACRRGQLVDWPDLVRTLIAHARKGRPGIRRFREVLSANSHRNEVTDSDFEMLVLALLIEHGLPEPVLHHQVWDGDRFVAEVDLAYPQRKIAMECDGAVHRHKEVHERDLPRQNDLVLLGWTVLRFTPDRYWTRPETIVRDVRAAHRTRPLAQPATPAMPRPA
jgi:very-short-patch-repair endonuclease